MASALSSVLAEQIRNRDFRDVRPPIRQIPRDTSTQQAIARTLGDRLEHIKGILEVIQDAQERPRDRSALPESRNCCLNRIRESARLNQLLLKSADSHHAVMVGTDMIERQHVQAEGLEKKREIAVRAPKIEHRIAGRQSDQVAICPGQQLIEMR